MLDAPRPYQRATEDEIFAAHLYDKIDGPSSIAPIAEVLFRLNESDGRHFLDKITKSITKKSLDKAGLVFLFEGEWIPLDQGAGAGAFLEARIEALGLDIAQEVYVRTIGINFGQLKAWAEEHSVSLPQWMIGLMASADVGEEPDVAFSVAPPRSFLFDPSGYIELLPSRRGRPEDCARIRSGGVAMKVDPAQSTQSCVGQQDRRSNKVGDGHDFHGLPVHHQRSGTRPKHSKGGRPPKNEPALVRAVVFELMDYHGEFTHDDKEWNAKARLENAVRDKLNTDVAESTLREAIQPALETWRAKKAGNQFPAVSDHSG